MVSRNDACPCGSGKKYKKCCLASDESRAPTAFAAPHADAIPLKPACGCGKPHEGAEHAAEPAPATRTDTP